MENEIFKIEDGVLTECLDKEVTSVKIPDGITKIGDYAFQWCTELQSIEIPDSVTKIGNGAFVNCINLTEINIPDNVTEIGEGAFYCCISLKEINIPDNVDFIGIRAFASCINLKEINIPDSVIGIADATFENCKSLEKVNLPKSVEVIYDKAFVGCINLKEINIPDSVSYIGDIAFENCKSLEKIKLPDSVTFIGHYAFNGCNNLEKVNIPDSVKKIGAGAFNECKSLKEIRVPDGVTSIEMATFANCTSLEKVNLPESVETIYYNAFTGCTNLKEINIPDSVSYIEDKAFENCKNLEKIKLPDSVAFDKDAFAGCEKLEIEKEKNNSSVDFHRTEAIQYALDLAELELVKTDDGFEVYDNANECYITGSDGKSFTEETFLDFLDEVLLNDFSQSFEEKVQEYADNRKDTYDNAIDYLNSNEEVKQSIIADGYGAMYTALDTIYNHSDEIDFSSLYIEDVNNTKECLEMQEKDFSVQLSDDADYLIYLVGNKNGIEVHAESVGDDCLREMVYNAVKNGNITQDVADEVLSAESNAYYDVYVEFNKDEDDKVTLVVTIDDDKYYAEFRGDEPFLMDNNFVEKVAEEVRDREGKSVDEILADFNKDNMEK